MKVLRRSKSDRFIAGVCGGIGKYLEIDPNVVRLVWVIGTVLTGVWPGVFVYGLVWLLIPEDEGPVATATTTTGFEPGTVTVPGLER